jgi:hypothetical protein
MKHSLITLLCLFCILPLTCGLWTTEATTTDRVTKVEEREVIGVTYTPNPDVLIKSIQIEWLDEEQTYLEEKDKEPLLDEKDHALIFRMTEGIYNWKAGVDKDGTPQYRYWECGVELNAEEAFKRAYEWADNIVYWAKYYTVRHEQEINPWGIAGTTALESAFDICALGLFPRKAAYEIMENGKPMLSPNPLTVSHTKEEVLYAINHAKLRKKFRAFDLGGLQTLDKFYLGDPEDLLTMSGFVWQIEWMYKYVLTFKTDKPWAYWPGRFNIDKHNKVVWFARQLGATRKDLI